MAGSGGPKGAPAPLVERLRRVRLIVLDVDGVLTDGGLVYGPGDLELKRFDAKDGAGIYLSRLNGIEVGILTGRRSEAVEKRAAELGLGMVRQGVLDKAAGFGEMLESAGVEPGDTAYVGDDVLDLPAMRLAGVSACPADAHPLVRERADVVCERAAGHGAVREFIDRVLETQGKLEAIASRYWEGSDDA